MISYNFYKNIIYSMPLVCFGWLSGWSSQTTYDIYLLQVYNVFFTAWPIIIFAVFDFEYPKQVFLEYPQLYAKGLRDNLLCWSKYFNICLESMLHGLFVFVIGFLYFDGALGVNGETSDMRTDGNLIYAACVILVTIKIIIDSHTINILVIAFDVLSMAAYYGFVWLMSRFQSLDIFDQFDEMNQFNQQWAVIFLLTFCALPLNQLWFAFNEYIFVQEESKGSEKRENGD